MKTKTQQEPTEGTQMKEIFSVNSVASCSTQRRTFPLWPKFYRVLPIHNGN
jgi:hypothetical protein